MPVSPGPARWVLSQSMVAKSGHPISPTLQDEITRHTQALHGPAADAYLNGLGLHLKIIYQPTNRFWTFQIIEASMFIGIAATLLGIAIWHLHHRST